MLKICYDSFKAIKRAGQDNHLIVVVIVIVIVIMMDA